MNSSRSSIVAIFCIALASSACARQQPNYCDTAPDHNCEELSSSPDAGTLPPSTGCSRNMGVNGITCSGMTPVCDNNICRACKKHADCTTNLCLPDGSCAMDSDVAYVTTRGTGSDCTNDAPCATLMNALNKRRNYIKISGTISGNANLINGQVVAIFADKGSQLTRNDNHDGPILEITGQAQVQIYDLEITGAKLSNGDGIQLHTSIPDTTILIPTLTLKRVTIDNNNRNGITLTNSNLTVEQSIISGNKNDGVSTTSINNPSAPRSIFTITQSSIFSNNNSSIDMQAPGAFTITNNFIYRNSDNINLLLLPDDTNIFEFNTIINNNNTQPAPAGISCNISTPPAGSASTGSSSKFSIPYNIILNNTTDPSDPQISDGCDATNSLVASGSNSDFSIFVNAKENNYHLSSTAGPSVDNAVQSCNITFDIDGDSRPYGQKCDLGADER